MKYFAIDKQTTTKKEITLDEVKKLIGYNYNDPEAALQALYKMGTLTCSFTILEVKK
jgi:hypothetical protein